MSQSVQLQSQNKKARRRRREISHRNGTVVHTETGTGKSSTLREKGAGLGRPGRPAGALTCHSCRVHSSSRCCSSHAGCRRRATTSGRAPEDLNRQFTSCPRRARESGEEECVLHRARPPSRWSDNRSDRRRGVEGPAEHQTHVRVHRVPSKDGDAWQTEF